MKWLCYMGILKESLSAYSSPVMLISRKLIKHESSNRFWTFKCQNSKKQFGISFGQRYIQSSKMWSIISPRFKDAFHSLRLSENSKKCCGILPYLAVHLFISENGYGTEHLPFYMAIIYKHDSWLSSKQKILWGNYGWPPTIQTIKKVSHRQTRRSIESIIEKWIKISPKKCQLFRTNLQYMGNKLFIQNKRVCVKPLRSRLEAIQKAASPTTVKGCRSFGRDGQFPKCVLSRFTKINKANIWLNQER